MLVSRVPVMESVLIESLKGGTPRTPSSGRTVFVVVLVLAVAAGQELVHEYENLPHQNGTHQNATNATDVVPSAGQRFAAEYFKCRCEGNQVWNSSLCRDKQTNVSVLLPDTQSVVVALTDDFAGVTVRDVQCPENYAKVNLDSNRSPSHQFTLLANGSLSWQQREYEHYCLEHTLDDHGKLTWEANVCLPPPSVPRCCLEGMTPSAYGLSCSDRLAQPFLPPISIGEDFMVWPKVVSTNGRNCSALETSLELPLNTGKASLLYKSGEVFLEWKTDHHVMNKLKDGFCVMPEEGRYVATVCYEDHEVIRSTFCEDATCVLKCCPEGEIHGLAVECVRAENETQLWKPSFADADNLRNVTPPKDLKVWHGRPQCPMYQADPQIDADTFFLLGNGFLFTPAATKKFDPPMSYCVDNFLNFDNTVSTKALICFEEVVVEPVCSIAKSTLFPALLLVSTAFLGLTLVIYLSMPDLRNKLHGRCLISLTSAFFVSYVLMAITYLSDLSDSAACIVLAFFKHLGLLAAFFWLNVMCFDIWRALRKTRVIQGGRWAVRRFLLYSLYAWGCALVIAVVALAVELLPESYDVIRPNFQNDACWFPVTESKSLWIYLYLWMSLVVAANIVFFGLVVVILVKGQNNSLLRRSREANRERMWLYVKLFLVMGVTWVAEMLSHPTYRSGKCAQWLFTDIINCLQGLTLFLVFIFSRSTLKKLKEKCCGGRPHRALSPSNTYTSSISSSTTVTKKFSNTSSNFKDFNAESGIPMKTLSEVPEESSCLKPPQSHLESTEKENELLSLRNGDAE